ncbi:MAG: peptidylprolyl isomerase [Candidatus Pacearchaeota archaeon]|nr:peptidylprolyl isomerase [Candidatus Pacearchaeota archaeon]
MKVKKGCIVVLDYEGSFENGEVFDSSKKHGKPFEFISGEGQVVKGFDKAIEGMGVGEEKEFIVKPEDGYGERRDELEQKVPRDVLPKEQEPKVGMILVVGNNQGQQMPVKITAVDEETITVDLNHPLAGKTLKFKVKVLEVRESDKEKKEEKLEDLADKR